ncbi:sulfotransferase domain-containing protein [Paraglaciecola aquimarina]|uniref:Sulfotransferase domain-containing protein n=1 Tax=Paraglaciecola algarum TaxID=3050085 RepID=A0ABS9DC31_9ALTE|nr:sulfotransferase [Paraglaciecola sp. G1-23]MCF2949890.1 sulfotransferase domain-containing protein [Paraglaciecola sp. G1-23]
MIDFIILGAQKAATSALQASLRQHPSIFMPVGESPFFEDPDYQSAPWKSFASTAAKQTIKGIKRPDYLCSDQARDRIKVALPNCKFIIVLREPISRTISSYCYMVRHAHLPPLPLNIGLANCIEDFKNGKNNRASSVITYGLYGLHITKWMKIYDPENFLILSQDEVAKDLNGALQKCLTHLGVSKDKQGEIPIAKGESNIGLYDPQMLKIAHLASKIKTRPIPNTERRIPRFILLRIIGVLMSKYAEKRAKKKGQNREVMSDDIKNNLEALYSEDAKLLSSIVTTTEFNWLK